MSLVDRSTLINQGRGGDFWIDEDGILICRDRVCVLDIDDLKRNILEKWHRSGLSIYLGATKISIFEEIILVARYEERDCRICVFLFDLLEVED